jgi:hypothetical protein
MPVPSAWTNPLAQAEYQRRVMLVVRRRGRSPFCASLPARHTFGASLARTSSGWIRASNTVAARTATGRPLPTAGVGYPVLRPEGQLSGVESARPTGTTRPRVCENSAVAQFPGSSNPFRDADRRFWADLEDRLCARTREARVFTRPRPSAVIQSANLAAPKPP